MANVLVIGSGGREHATVKSILDGCTEHRIFCYPGNGGISEIAECPKSDIALSDPHGLLSLAEHLNIDLTIVGPELPLVSGISDCFGEAGKLLLGPSKLASQLEDSKVFSKKFMRKHGIPTADFRVFKHPDDALTYVRLRSCPLVIKADGLCGGKGVFVCQTEAEARKAIQDLMVDRIYGAAGNQIVIEELLKGRECSFFILVGSTSFVEFGAAVDYKRAFDGDLGPNTGGMGAYSPAVFDNPNQKEQIIRQIVEPTIDGLLSEGIVYRGWLYIGLMLTPHGPKVLEYNVRLGDPEAQVLLPRLSTKVDVYELFRAAAEGLLGNLKTSFNGTTVGVVAVSGKYPQKEKIKHRIKGPIRALEAGPHINVFHGATLLEDSQFFATSGRVLTVVGKGRDYEEAASRAYQVMERISFENIRYRTDIARTVRNKKTLSS